MAPEEVEEFKKIVCEGLGWEAEDVTDSDACSML
jgi:hypothetical protein